MTTTQELLKSSFELNLNNYGPEDVERLNDWAIEAYAALEALQAEVVRLRVIAKEAAEYATKHQTEVLRLQAQLAAAQGQLKHLPAAPIPQPPAPSDTAREYMTGYSDGREWAGATSQAQQAQSVPEPVLQWCDKCGEGTVQGLCRGKLDDCKFKQAQPEAGVQSILDEMAEDEQLLMDRDMGDS